MRMRLARALAAGAVTSLLAFPVPSRAETPPAADLRLGDDVVPLAQRLELRLDPAATDFTGSTEVELLVRRPSASFRFHAEAMELRAATLAKAGEEPRPLALTPLDAMVVEARPQEPLAPGRYRLRIEFANDFGTQGVGLYRTEHQGASYLFTQMEAVDAREAFPCWDEPAFKIPYRFALTVPQGLVAATNAPVEREEPAGEGWRTLTYAETPPLPSYLLAIAVGPFDVVPMPGLAVPGRVLAPRGQGALAAEAVRMAPPLVAALEEWFEQRYPYAKLDLVAVPEYWYGAMENPGLVTFQDEILLAPASGPTAGWRARYASIFAHEIAHMWFGDVVTMTWWDDLWLNEAFADFLGDRVADRVHPELGIAAGAARSLHRILVTDARPSAPAIRQPVDRVADVLGTVGLAYAKGSTVLGMVEHWLGPETFRRGVLTYLARHTQGNAVAADLWDALAEASGQDVARVLQGFLDQPGYPLIDVEVVDRERGRVVLTQRRYTAAGVSAPPLEWTVPMVLAWSDGARRQERPVLLAGPRQEVELGGPVAWLLPDSGARGYYRWRLAPAELAALVAAAGDELGVLERMALLGNTDALLRAAALPGPEYLRLLGAMADDPDPGVVEVAIDRLVAAETAFSTAETAEPFATFLRSALRPALERIGATPRPGEEPTVSRLRPRLLYALGDIGRDAEVRADAARAVREDLTGAAPLDPALAGYLLRLAAIDGDLDLFAAYRRRFEAATAPDERSRLLAALGEFRRPEARQAALDYAATGPLRPDEMFEIPFTVSGDHDAGAEAAVRWIEENFALLGQRVPAQFLPGLSSFGRGCSPERLAAVRAILEAHEVAGADAMLRRVGDDVASCVALREREGAAVAAWLRQHGGTEPAS